MNSNCLVGWTITARKDLSEIASYIAEDNLDASFMFLDKIEKRGSELWQFPEQGRVVPELNDFGIVQYREVMAPPWRVVYRIAGKQVLIMAVFDGRRNLGDVLLERFRLTYV